MADRLGNPFNIVQDAQFLIALLEPVALSGALA